MTDQTDHRADPVQAVAEVLEVHQIEFIDWTVGWDCGCNERGHLPGMPTLTDALRHQAEAAVAAARPAIEREAKAERDALAARLAAVEALADRMAKIHNRLHGDVEINHHEFLRSARDYMQVMHDDLRAALATGATTNQQEDQ